MCVDILLRLVMRICQDASVIFKDWAKALSLVLPGKNMLKKCKNVLSMTLRSEDVNLARVWASRSWCFLRSLISRIIKIVSKKFVSRSFEKERKITM